MLADLFKNYMEIDRFDTVCCRTLYFYYQLINQTVKLITYAEYPPVYNIKQLKYSKIEYRTKAIAVRLYKNNEKFFLECISK